MSLLPVAEIIAVGTELTSGAKLDTNSQWISRELADRGITVKFHTTVSDDLPENIEAVRTAAARSALVLITGGLGPTRDDLTREMLAQAAGVPLEEDPAAVTTLESFFSARGRTMPPRNLLQAQKPRGAELLDNPVGTAPGIWLPIPRSNSDLTSYVAAMPGVPSEMKPMLLEQVVPRLAGIGLTGSATIARRIINCYGIGESAAEEMLGELTDRGRDPEVGITASAATISLRVLAAGASQAEAEAKADAAEAEVNARLAEYIFGRDTDDVEDALVRDLLGTSHTVATIEVGTGGELASRLDRVDDRIAADVVTGSFVVTRPDRDRLVIGSEPAAGESPYSAERAQRLAVAARERTAASFGLAIVADPEIVAASPTPAGAIGHFAVASESGVESAELTLLGNPAIHRPRLAKSAMTLLRRHLAAGRSGAAR